MANEPFRLPGSDLLRLGDLFLPGGRNSSQPAPPPKPKLPGLGTGGGSGRRNAPAPEPSEDLEALDMTAEEAVPETKPAEPEAVLSEACWVKPDTLFQEEADVTVKLKLPPGKEHLTRVVAELHAKRAKGIELIAKAEGNAAADGTATIALPIYQPQGYAGEVVEYFVKFTHKFAKALDEAILRPIQDKALKSADHVLVPGVVFEQNQSFVLPKAAAGLKALESKVKDWEKKFPKGKVVVFGHANPDEEYGKLLSERRAQSVFAFITNDADTWEKLYQKEKWGTLALQHILVDMKLLDAAPNGKHGPLTTEAFRKFQQRAGLEPDGKETPEIRKALFAAYMKGKHDIKIDAGWFRTVAGNPWMGCSANNRVKSGDKPAPENRRVAFILINESRAFPVNFPCQDGAEAGCAGQCGKKGKRSAAGIRCAFYDELVREEKQGPVVEPVPSPLLKESQERYDRISFAGYEGRGYVIKDFRKYEGGAIQLNPETIHPSGEKIPKGFNNQCVSYVRFFGLPQTITWKKGPRVCDMKPGELAEGTVVATMRDGIYHSDTKGRSHVGIYLKHDDYPEYLKSPDKSSGVRLMDQYFGAPIQEREKKYSVNADEEKKSSPTPAWQDTEGNTHDYRVRWVDDGEEYFVVLTDP